MTCPACGASGYDARRPCPGCGFVSSETISARAERRLVTVLFADISGFTALSEGMDPEDVREVVNECLGDLAAVVLRYGGTVDKFIGDAVMALFGAPHAHEDDPERAAAAALEMRQALATASARMADRLPDPLALHVGINTGLVVAGRVGSADRSEYTVMGDAVNVAAKLEDLAGDGQILVSESTHAATRHAFNYRSLPPATVKGKREPVTVFELSGVAARRRSARGLPGIETPFVGRGQERVQLEEALAALGSGRGGLVTISGPAGVGKSRLLREVRRTAQERGIGWVHAGTSSLAQSGALALWGDAVRRLLMLRSGIEQRTVAFDLRRDPTAETPALDPARSAAALATVLGVGARDGDSARLDDLDEGALRGQLFLAVRDLIEAQVARGPLVIALEDLHWADEASFDLLRFVGESTGRLPLLLVATYRADATTVAEHLPEGTPAAGALRRAIELPPLTDDDCRALAEAVLGADAHMAPVRSLLVEQAEGNPLYLEEILRALAQQGAIAATPDGWQLTADAVEAVLPPSLQGLLLVRIDRLPERHKRLLQIAAVTGRQFPPELVWQIAEEDEAATLLDDLVRDGFLERAESIAGLRFRHALMQEAAYSSLLLRHRRAYHRRVAEALEAQPDLWAVRAELPAALTQHWERAEAWDHAADWALRAADQARRAFAPAEAARLYARALAAAGRIEDAALARAALAGAADAELAQGNAEAALAAADRALTLGPDEVERGAFERRRGQALGRLGMQASAAEAYARATAALGEPREDEPDAVRAERSTLRIQVAFSHLARGAALLARAAAEEVLRLDGAGDDAVDARRLLGMVALQAGDHAGAAAHAEAGLLLARALGDLPREAILTEQLARTQVAAGEHAAGIAGFRVALEQYERVADASGAARCLYELGEDALTSGCPRRATEMLREATRRASAADEATLAARAGLRLGRALAVIGDWQAAADAFDRAGADDAETAGFAALERALAEVMRGGTPGEHLRATLAAAADAGQTGAAARARIALATLARRRGAADEARTLLRTVLEGGIDENSEEAIVARAGLAQLAAAAGAGRPAVIVAARALAVAEAHGPATAAWYARRIYGMALAAAGRPEQAERELRAVVEATRAAEARSELAAALSHWARVRRALGDPTGAADALAELRAIGAGGMRTEG